ncbi:replication restart DNA helicase PriA [Lyngbya confervoides]|uniref:Replication restart DNA helicase PriA n=1 Tax=Lyngbya confervoides BDU141951 TaxID=1574623 RepID=A0ABD4T188_9CYAN|nr:replication restart DNA helicase PriA [Lyngbya confervoides]MCM1982200.1 replication restart DNA helicase PriA [Lyngbya confervoides BDU141951]
MNHVTQVRCPNCGSHATRDRVKNTSLIRTQCRTCDYLLITCNETGRVIESYAPGLSMVSLVNR